MFWHLWRDAFLDWNQTSDYLDYLGGRAERGGAVDRRGRWSVEEEREKKHREAREEGDAEQSRARGT